MPQNSTLRGSDVITGSAVPEGAALHPETKGGGGVESRNTQGVWGEEADRVTLFSNILRLLLPPSTSPSIIDYILLRCYRDITVPRRSGFQFGDYLTAHIFLCVCVSVCVFCVRETERGKEGEGEREGGREREREREILICLIYALQCVNSWAMASSIAQSPPISGPPDMLDYKSHQLRRTFAVWKHMKNRQQFGGVIAFLCGDCVDDVLSFCFVCYPLLCCCGRTENVGREKKKGGGLSFLKHLYILILEIYQGADYSFHCIWNGKYISNICILLKNANFDMEIRLNIHWLKFLISSQLIFKDSKIQTLVFSTYNEVLIPSHANTLLVLRDITHKNTQTHTGRKIGRNANQRAMQGKGIEKNWQLLGGGEELKKKQKRNPKKWLNKRKLLERRGGKWREGGKLRDEWGNEQRQQKGSAG
ncbi:hypothetical protein L345_05658, partial [Ophiophagus hannah]